jgi:hypothetical protein
MSSYDTIQDAAERAAGTLGQKTKADFFIGANGKVTPIDEGAKAFIEAANSGVGLKPGDEDLIVRDVVSTPGAHHKGHIQPMDGGYAVSIYPVKPLSP